MEDVRSLLEQIRSGQNPQLRQLAARGLLPIAPEELIPLQIALATGDDAELASQAMRSLESTDPRLLASFVSQAAGGVEEAYFARHLRHPLIIEALIRRRTVQRPLLVELAPKLAEDLQEILLLRQDAIVEVPEILDALETNPKLSSYARRRVKEYRQHLIRREKDEEETVREEEEVSEEEVAEAIEKAREVPAEGEKDEEGTGLSEGQIRTLAVPIRMRLAQGASRTLRNILIRDPNPRVAVAVVKGNALSDQEVERICQSRAVCDEVLEEVSRHREWMGKYNVISALAHNPKTPVQISMKILPRLSVRDLKDLSRSRNIPDAVRSNSARLYRIKSQ